MEKLLTGVIKGFSKPFGFIGDKRFHVRQVSGGIENGATVYYDLSSNGNINMVYGREATFPECYLENSAVEEIKTEIVETVRPLSKKKNYKKRGK